MIDQEVKIHDKFTIETKVGFVGRGKSKFTMNTWFFVPGSLDINRHTYSKENFFKDIKSNIRLITPVFLLKDIVESEKSPLHSINKLIKDLSENNDEASLKELEYQFKMFNSILKSSLREEIRSISKLSESTAIDAAIDTYTTLIKTITAHFRAIENELNFKGLNAKAKDYFSFCDEFMSVLIEVQSFRLLRFLEKNDTACKDKNSIKIVDIIRHETAYKQSKAYLSVDKNSGNKNRFVIFRHGILKKYIESELFLNTIKKEDGFLVRQFVYSLAAGISMVFATIIAFSFQKEYGNFTVPFFVALVVGYMLKDRIKELSRYYFAHKLRDKYFDLKTVISIGKDKIGLCKESFDFISNEKAPAEILKVRNRTSLIEANNKFNEEQIILYRMQVETDNDLINKHSAYEVDGINNIVRYNIASLIYKMDNPELPMYILDDNAVSTIIEGEKVYFVNLLIQLQQNEQKEIKHYRLVINRDGIKEIEKIQ